MGRAGLAVFLLVAWAAALGWQAKRVFFPAGAERLAFGVSTLPPGVAYYAVFRNQLRAGWGQVEIDTLPAASGFFVRDRVLLDQPSLGVAGRSERSSEEFLDAGLNLDSLTHTSIIGEDTAKIRAVAEGDSVVRLFDATGRQTGRVPILESVTTTSGWRLRLAAAGEAEPGRRYGVVVFDPLAASAREQEIEILETTSVVYPDSADTDSISGIWIPVREDTVRAWRVQSGQGDAARETWIDEDGRLVDGEIFGGLRVERTAFELAFFTRPGSAARDSVRSQQEEPE
ncbi:MAG: hypothetical protein KJO06_02400 [Gemmatimonadetes bacterium]|nr:hypothetical protein [Gemmatimonadota bacterium]NNK49126.1 hypothetical protein [Gemmatimonadota bacterium]